MEFTTDYTKRFCSSGCRECYQEDRRAGLIYGLCAVTDSAGKKFIVGWRDGAYLTGICKYCSKQIASEKTSARRIEKYVKTHSVEYLK